jgi:hypothetical protein
MAIRAKRSVSLPPDLARRIERAAAREDTTVSAWIASTAEHRLKIEDGLRAVAEFERENGAFTPAELARGRAIVDAALGIRERPRARRRP